MLQSIFQNASSATTYVVMALVLFFSVFVSVVLREILRPRREVDLLADMPLQDDARNFPSSHVKD